MRKIIWLTLSCLMVLSLVLSACAPKAAEEKQVTPKEEGATKEVATKAEAASGKTVVIETKTNMVEWQGTKLNGTVVQKMIEKPKYGGTIVTAEAEPPLGFDEVALRTHNLPPNRPTNETLLQVNWSRGPLGTEEWTKPPLADQAGPNPENYIGILATRWEIPEPDKVVFQIRQGVHFAIDPNSEASRLVNGRELTAEDIVYNYRRNWSQGYLGRSYPELRNMKNPAESVYVSPTDKWAVVLEAGPSGGPAVFRVANEFQAQMPREVIEKYGNMNDWRNVVGTGPYMLKDYVSGSSVTYVKNPNYWGRDDFFPENRLPYPDTFRVLIIPDMSTRVTAMRTSKIDFITALGWEDANSLMKSRPDLKSVKILGSAYALFPRNDVKPFDDIRVRRALNMAIDNEAIARDYYGGQAEIFAFPISSEFSSHTPLAEMPESVKELYGYYPEKAKQLLAEAGYPNGFRTEVLTRAVDVDMLSIIKGYWGKIGVNLEFTIKDPAVYNSMANARTYPEIFMGSVHITAPNTFMVKERPGKDRVTNQSMLMEQWVDDYYYAIMDNFFDPAKVNALFKEYAVKAAERAWYVVPPVPYQYNVWQPWLKNFEGITSLSKFGGVYAAARRLWIDQELKKKLSK